MSSLIQGTKEWLEMRREHIGASDAPVIMEVSPWHTAFERWEEKLGLRINKDNRGKKQGRDKEEEARQAFEKETGLFMFPMVLKHPSHSWMIASLDGIDIERKNIVEIKNPDKEDHEKALDGQVPAKYYPQLQHQMEVCGTNKNYYYSYYKTISDTHEVKISTKIIEVYRDQPYIDKMLPKELKFYECVRDLVAPELTERDYIKRDDEQWLKISSDWKRSKAKLDEIEKEEKRLRSDLIQLSNKRNCIGGNVRLTRVIRKGAVDYNSIEELNKIDLEKYRKTPIESWRLTMEK